MVIICLVLTYAFILLNAYAFTLLNAGASRFCLLPGLAGDPNRLPPRRPEGHEDIELPISTTTPWLAGRLDQTQPAQFLHVVGDARFAFAHEVRKVGV